MVVFSPPGIRTQSKLCQAISIESAEAHSATCAAVARRKWLDGIFIDWRWFGSTCSVFAGHWTHLTQSIVSGDGLTESHVDSLESFELRLKAVPTVHVAETFDSRALRTCGYRLLGASDVMALDPRRNLPKTAGTARPVCRHDRAVTAEWIRVASEHDTGDAPTLEIGGVVAEMARTHLFAARSGEQCVSAGALFVQENVGILFCDATLPEFRGNGYQRDLIASRVHAAVASGCDLVTATVEPNSASARNYQRMGFRKAYSRLTFQRPC